MTHPAGAGGNGADDFWTSVGEIEHRTAAAPLSRATSPRGPAWLTFVDSPHFFGIKETGVGNANFKNLEEQQASLAATSYLAHYSQLDFLKTFSLPVRWDVARH
jgi:hypothetical protein